MKFLSIFLLIFATSCVETVIVGSVGGAVVATREKTLQNMRTDLSIFVTLEADFITHKLKLPDNYIDCMVNEGRVLLVGNVNEEEKSKLAEELTWKALGVKEVMNEIKISEEKLSARKIMRLLGDYLVTAAVETKLLLARDVVWPNYKITTIAGTVYLLGIAQNDFEMQRVLTVVSKIRGVESVVNHVMLKDDERRQRG